MSSAAGNGVLLGELGRVGGHVTRLELAGRDLLAYFRGDDLIGSAGSRVSGALRGVRASTIRGSGRECHTQRRETYGQPRLNSYGDVPQHLPYRSHPPAVCRPN